MQSGGAWPGSLLGRLTISPVQWRLHQTLPYKEFSPKLSFVLLHQLVPKWRGHGDNIVSLWPINGQGCCLSGPPRSAPQGGRAATGPVRSKRQETWFCHLAVNPRWGRPRGHERPPVFGTSPGTGQGGPKARGKTRWQPPGQAAAALHPSARGSCVQRGSPPPGSGSHRAVAGPAYSP